MNSIKILDVRVDFGLTPSQAVEEIDKKIQEGTFGNLVSTTNAEFVMSAQEDAKFRDLINSSFLSLPDGVGVIFAKDYLSGVSKLQRDGLFGLRAFLIGVGVGLKSFFGKNLSDERITGRELMYDMCQLASDKGYSVYFLGGWEKDAFGKQKEHHGNISEKAAEKLSQKYPGMKIVGASSDFSHKVIDDERSVEKIKKDLRESGLSKIDILFVAYNHSNQEKWIERNSRKINACVCMGVGGSFDFVAGGYKTAPEIFVKLNLEWLFRLFSQPWRLKRILIAFPIFPIQVYLKSIKK